MGAKFIQVFFVPLVVFLFSGTSAEDSAYRTRRLPFRPAFQLQVSKLDKKAPDARLPSEDHKIHRLLFPQTEPESLDALPQMDAAIEPESPGLPQMDAESEPVSLGTLPQMYVVNPVTTFPRVDPSTPTTTTPTYNPLPNPVTNPTPTTNPEMNPTNPPANPVMGGAPATSTGQSWCVATPSASQTALQVGLDYACGYGGADCSAIQQGGSCFNPDTVRDHASYAYNSYYHTNPVPTSCDFSGTAMITNTVPSTSTCQYPSSSTSSSSAPITNNPAGPTGFGSSPPVFGSSPPSVFGSSPPDYSDSSSSSRRMPSSSMLMMCLPMSLVYVYVKTLRL